MALNSEQATATCKICPHECRLHEGQVGLCRARINAEGKVIDQNYGRITSIALDPIEKKPLARFMPGARVLSVGSYGCNLRCPFCQNSSIACAGEDDVPWRYMSPQELVDLAKEAQSQDNCGVAYTYNEPMVGLEFVRDTGKLVHEAGMKNVVVTNGMVNAEPLSEVLPLIDAANVDLKGFTQNFCDFVDGNLECVKETIATMAATSTCHLEVTTLIVPGWNDSADEISEAAEWLASLDPNIPYHISRFFPYHEMSDADPTPVSKIYELAEVAKKHLKYVYTGNC